MRYSNTIRLCESCIYRQPGNYCNITLSKDNGTEPKGRIKGVKVIFHQGQPVGKCSNHKRSDTY